MRSHAGIKNGQVSRQMEGLAHPADPTSLTAQVGQTRRQWRDRVSLEQSFANVLLVGPLSIPNTFGGPQRALFMQVLSAHIYGSITEKKI